MAFDDVRLPVEVEKGAQGGPRFKTTIISLSSGFERRNSDWSQTRGEWDIGYGIRKKSSLSAVINFFYARNGRARGFRFKDWTDYELARQAIGVTDGSNTLFQIYKRYTSGTSFDRHLKKIVADSASVWVNGVSITEGAGSSQFQLNDTTGVITLGSTLAAQSGTSVEVECEFDVPVRFDTDGLNIVADYEDAIGVPQIPIIEIRVS